MDMNWYYGLNGETVGPVDEDQVGALIQQGTITSETLVWNDQMGDNWAPANQTELNRFLTGEAASGAGLSPVGATAPVAGGAFCSLCGNSFPESDLVEIGNLSSCAACKPMALRRMQENTFSGVMNYAGFWIRVGAAIVDAIIMVAVQFAVGFIIGFLVSDPAVSAIVLNVVQILIGFSYSVFLISSNMGGTLGMKACGIQVVNADGSGPISIGKAIGRYFAAILSSLILCIGYLMVAFDAEKRALHDHICGTRVVYR
jgi:uncharacterized RDD family membrane protein YckC